MDMDFIWQMPLRYVNILSLEKKIFRQIEGVSRKIFNFSFLGAKVQYQLRVHAAITRNGWTCVH